MTADQAAPEFLAILKDILGLLESGKVDRASDRAEELAALAPDAGETVFVVGVLAHAMQDNGRAIELISSALKKGPEYREYADTLAVLYTLEGALADGLYYAKLATTLEPHPYLGSVMPQRLLNYCNALKNVSPSPNKLAANVALIRRQYRKVIEHCERELRLNRNDGAAYGLLGQGLLGIGDAVRAADMFRTAIHLEPSEPWHFAHLANALYQLGRPHEAATCSAEALRRTDEVSEIAAVGLAGLRFLGDAGEGAARSFLAAMTAAVSPLAPRRDASAAKSGKTLRLGVISNSFFHSDTAAVFAAFASHLNRGEVELYLYQQSPTEDGITTQIRGAGNSWRPVYNMDGDTLAAIIEGDEIDVLVDLCGATRGHRLAVFAKRPAPLQVGWLKYPHGAGLPGIDAVVSDEVLQEGDRAALADGQELIVLPRGVLALEPLILCPEVNELPARRNSEFTFGATADLALATPQAVAAWAQALAAVPSSRILVGGPHEITPAMQERILELFANVGCVNRVAFWRPEGNQGSRDLAFFGEVDVYLDTIPVSGEIELAHALWMGVPALTVRGKTRPGAAGASVLTSAGRPEWIAADPLAMADTAAELAADLDTLGELRRGLREQVRASALFDPAGLATALVAGLRAAL
jgi:protein O-GlcNAc transferase